MSLIINPYIAGASVPSFLCANPSWSGVSNASNVGGVLTKTSANNWDMGAVSVGTLSGDARLVLYAEDYSYQYMVGMGLDSTCSTYSTIDHAWFLNFSAYNIYENNTNVYSNSINPFFNVMFVLERIGTSVNYYVLAYTGPRPLPTDGNRIHVRGPVTVSAGTLYVNVAIYSNGGTVDAADVCWNSITGGILDNFNRADDAVGLGTSSSGHTWLTNQGTIGILSNTAHTYALGSGRANSTIETSESDAIIETVLTAIASNGTIGGIIFRYTDNNNYFRFTDSGSADGKATLVKCVAGSNNDLIAFTAASLAAGSRLKVVLNGSSIKCYVDDVQIGGTQTDSFNVAATQHGLFSSGGTPTMDNFIVVPLV